MATNRNADAILDALHRLRREIRGVHRLPEKRQQAIDLIEHRYAELRRELGATKLYAPLSCVMLIHRLVLTVSVSPRSAFPWTAIGAIPGARVGRGRMLFKRQYGLSTPIRGVGELKSFFVESNPTNGFVAPFRITIVPGGREGLQWDDLRTVLELLPNFKFVLVEVAWDFPLMSIVDIDYVRKRGLFGKSRPRSVEINPLHETWGGRKATKFVRSYVRYESDVHRAELEMHARALREYAIDSPFDFPRLVQTLLDRHILFGRLDGRRVVRRLRREGFSERQRRNVLDQLKDREGNIWEALRYLRRRVHLSNVRRLLVPVRANRLLREAAADWARTWPTKPTRLGKTP